MNHGSDEWVLLFSLLLFSLTENDRSPYNLLINFIYYAVKYVLKRVSFGSKDCTKELKLECAYFLSQLD